MLSFSAVWSGSRSTVILRNSLIRVYTVCHPQQSDQGLHCLSFSAVWSRSRSRSTLSFSETVWSGSTLFAIDSSLIRVYTVCHSQLSDQRLHCLPFSAVWSGSALFAILSSLIRVYTICLSQQSDQGLHCLPFSAVWSVSTLFAILRSLIRIYTVCQTAAVLCPWARHFTPRMYWLITQEAVAPSRHDWKIVDWDVKPQHKQTNKTVCQSQQSDQGLNYFHSR